MHLFSLLVGRRLPSPASPLLLASGIHVIHHRGSSCFWQAAALLRRPKSHAARSNWPLSTQPHQQQFAQSRSNAPAPRLQAASPVFARMIRFGTQRPWGCDRKGARMRLPNHPAPSPRQFLTTTQKALGAGAGAAECAAGRVLFGHLGETPQAVQRQAQSCSAEENSR